ncbi:palmitoyltransferase ZDHHC18-B-like isoform X2 [Synchiropus splendidus]|uniref:palmitoyltransferase ZDHHC18-B-like isoform X2 n=1 Tax=Synchiropus splendidus TaxID=270530 RepID=UPI00237EAEFC|nr:palmitoyltransferase ZDHHC18-B-like isoform X2 [Synchiropus splendidus]
MNHSEYQRTDPPLPLSPAARELRNKENNKKESRIPRKRWEVFPGKNRFLCNGRVIMAGNTGVLPLTLGLIVVTSGLFFTFDSPFLVKRLTSGIPVIAGVLFVFVVTTLLRTSFSDPGILPRATPDEAADTEEKIDNTDTDVSENGNCRPPPRIKEVVINQQVVKLKYCFTCRMFRPPRTSHCSLCDNCVEAQNGKGLVFVLKENLGSAVELVICFLAVWSILGLSGFHTFLVASNRTTNEDVKGTWSAKNGADDITNPYSHHNILVNCCSVLCGPMPPSLINRRGLLHQDVLQNSRTDIQATINLESQDLLESLTSLTCPEGIPQSSHSSSTAKTNSSPEVPIYCRDLKTSLVTQGTTSPLYCQDPKSRASQVFCSSSNIPASLTSLDACSSSESS